MPWGNDKELNVLRTATTQPRWSHCSSSRVGWVADELPWFAVPRGLRVKTVPHPGPHEPEYRAGQNDLDHLERGKGLVMLATELLDECLFPRAHTQWVIL